MLGSVWLLTAAAVSACALSAGAPAPAAQSNPERIASPNGFSFLPPSGRDWTKSSGEQVSYVKKTDPREVSFFLGYVEGGLRSEFPDSDSLVAFVRSRKDDWGKDARYSNTKALIAVEPGQTSCVRYETTAHDHGASNRGSREFLVMTTTGRFCLHPSNRSVAIDMYYSIRQVPEYDPSRLTAEGEAFLGSLRFEQLPVTGT